MLLHTTAVAQNKYSVAYLSADADSGTLYNSLQLQQSFTSKATAIDYVSRLPALLQSKGYITSSVDSVVYDSSRAKVTLFLGEPYKWAAISTRPADADILQALHWNNNMEPGTPLNIPLLQNWQERILSYLEENGHPFAKVYLDSMALTQQGLNGILKIDRGPIYKVDSIRIYGAAKIDHEFLQRYLDIANGSIYNKKKLQSVDKKISQLTYVQEERPSNITLLGTGSVLNLYLKQKKSSQVNVLVGFLPNSDAASNKKFLITGEANILLSNALGAGETIGLNWQQLQKSSPKLNILYHHPYIFKSPLGLNFSLDMYRKDSTFLNIAMNLGASYKVGDLQEATVFLQKLQTIVNGVDTNYVLQYKRLPQQADVSSVNVGFTYSFNNTDYHFNPRKGADLSITAVGGTKNIKKNNQVLELKDPYDSSFQFSSLYDTVKLKSYQFRLSGTAARYFPVGRQSVLKTAMNAGLLQSGNYFINELFRIGGYRLLRGFDEESQYVSHYAIGTVEYRYLIGQNSNFFAFADGGWARHPLAVNKSHTYIGTGAGLAFETKAGIFNIVWAVGKRDDTRFNLRQSKVHLGFVNYF